VHNIALKKMIKLGCMVRHIDKNFDSIIGLMKVIEIKMKMYAVCMGQVRFYFPLSELELALN